MHTRRSPVSPSPEKMLHEDYNQDHLPDASKAPGGARYSGMRSVSAEAAALLAVSDRSEPCEARGRAFAGDSKYAHVSGSGVSGAPADTDGDTPGSLSD